ncbi:MAG: VOC family protein [Candidatus Doudnabacteria bacterium]|nr:VOC family protein [Candidatus Doudnabacteria bacterium]
MPQKITPFLWFESQAEEAMNYYVSIFNGNPAKKSESKVVSIKRYPDGITEGPMAGFDGKVLTGVFELEGQRFMALDGGPVFKATGAISFLVDCGNQDEIDYFWDKLTAGGDPNAQQCGWLMDKYGFSWQVVPDMAKWLEGSDKAKADKALQAMLKMKKIIIKDLDDAYNS